MLRFFTWKSFERLLRFDRVCLEAVLVPMLCVGCILEAPPPVSAAEPGHQGYPSDNYLIIQASDLSP
jgi:hypothetical protein